MNGLTNLTHIGGSLELQVFYCLHYATGSALYIMFHVVTMPNRSFYKANHKLQVVNGLNLVQYIGRNMEIIDNLRLVSVNLSVLNYVGKKISFIVRFPFNYLIVWKSS